MRAGAVAARARLSPRAGIPHAIGASLPGTGRAYAGPIAPPPHPTGEQFEIAFEEQRAVVVEVGAGLRRYARGAWEVLDGYGADEPVDSGRGQVLVPWPNRLRDGRWTWDGTTRQLALTEPEQGNAIHGLVRWQPWRAISHTAERVTMAVRLHPQAGWPFTLDVQVEYALGADGLSVRTTATNAGGEPCPYGAGQHPYLSLGDGAGPVDAWVVQAPGTRRLLADERQIPTGAEEPVDGTPYDFRTPRPLGALHVDDAFARLVRDADGRARVRMRTADEARELAVWMDDAYGWVMLFSGDTLPEPAARRRSLAVEPMTCAPNALASGDGLRTLAPGESFGAAWGIEAAKP